MLDDLRQDGCLKARFPRPRPDDWPGAVLLNSSGGIAGGDRLATTIAAGPVTRVTLAGQAAERVYRTTGPAAHVTTTLHVADGAALEWLPQETILFDRSALDRRLDVHVDPGGTFLGIEHLVFGRTAMGEAVCIAELRDRIVVHRGGILLYHDAIRLAGPVQAVLDRRATGGGARSIATLLLVGPRAADRLDPLRAALAGADAGASAWDGLLLARIAAPDGAAGRAVLAAALNVLRDGRMLPRVWSC